MAVSSSFKVLVVVSLVVTLIPKILIGAVVSNPTYGKVVELIAPFFVSQGFQVTYPAQFAGKEALIAMKDNCFMHVVPVAHQGWHQATVRNSVVPDQRLWFQFEGHLTEEEQETYYPLTIYYAKKAARHLGISVNFPPVLALITEGACSVQALNWNGLPEIPFQSGYSGAGSIKASER